MAEPKFVPINIRPESRATLNRVLEKWQKLHGAGIKLADAVDKALNDLEDAIDESMRRGGVE